MGEVPPSLSPDRALCVATGLVLTWPYLYWEGKQPEMKLVEKGTSQS